MKKNTFFTATGKFLAHFQNMVDEIAFFGFRKLKGIKPAAKEKTKKNGLLGRIKSIPRTLANGFGEMGTSYFAQYEELKKQKTAKKTPAKKTAKKPAPKKTTPAVKKAAPKKAAAKETKKAAPAKKATPKKTEKK